MEYTKNAPLKVFTAFSGYDSQCLALQRANATKTLPPHSTNILLT